MGSGSPRRLELLASIGVAPDDIRPPDIDEDPLKGELPRPYCERVTAEKLAAMQADTDDVILCGDTTVALGRRILGKPADAQQAASFLTKLQGRRHQVITSVAVGRNGQVWQKTNVTMVKMKRISDDELRAYLATNDWQGKAGGYSIQGPAGAFIPWIQGSYTGVMGLPVHETAALLVASGYPVYA